MKIFHASDLHYCSKHLKTVDRAFSYSVDHAINDRAELAVISGDSFDSAINVHEPAVAAFFKQVKRLADYMPVVVLQGTFSHDRPGSLNSLLTLGGKYPVYVADKAEQIILDYNSDFDDERGINDKLIINCLPSLNKAAPEIIGQGPVKYVENLMNQWSSSKHDIPSILISHGTVNGCSTESKHAMISPDHEFNPDVLFSSGCEAVMLGHIHKHQSWIKDNKHIAYPGSISRLVFGHMDPVGFLMWNVESGYSNFEFIPTPAPRLVDVTFDGAPNIDELKTIAGQVDEDDHVRIRYSVDQDFAHIVDKDEIKSLFNVYVLKIEGTINPVQSVRAAGIGSAMTLEEKLGYWAVTTGDEDRLDELTERLFQLQSMDVEEIIDNFNKPSIKQNEAA